MNFLSHGRDHIHFPYALAGTAAPDWVRVVHRRARFRAADIQAHQTEDPRVKKLLEGIERHIFDDVWFHQSPVFLALVSELSMELRRIEEHPRFRASFFGHILLEILLDAWLMDEQPGIVDLYYGALEKVDARFVSGALAKVLGKPLPRLPELINRFRAAGFLRGYQEDAVVLRRLDQMGQRVGLPPLPQGLIPLISRARQRIAEQAPALLTPPSDP